MADRKPDGRSGETSDDRYDFGRPEQRGFWQGIEGLLKNLPLGDMSEVVARSSRIGRARLDTFLLRREREQLLRELGRIVADEARAGRLNLPLSALDTWERLLGVETRLAEELRDVANVTASVGFPGEWQAPETAAPASDEAPEAAEPVVPAAPPARKSTPSARKTAKASDGSKSIGRRKPRTTAAKVAQKAPAASAGEKKSTGGRKAKTPAATGDKEVKKTVGRRAPRKKAPPGGSDGSSQ